MYDHLGLKVGNLDASVRFYTEALMPLGYVLCSRDETGAGFGPKDAPALWLYLHKGPAGAGTLGLYSYLRRARRYTPVGGSGQDHATARPARH